MKIYGIIRSGNKKSKKLIEKFGGKELKSISHYHQTGILYEVNIKR
jgi:hypothetical protein